VSLPAWAIFSRVAEDVFGLFFGDPMPEEMGFPSLGIQVETNIHPVHSW
jgi:hypothetical protein